MRSWISRSSWRRGSGAEVTKDVAANPIVAGVPARPIRATGFVA